MRLGRRHSVGRSRLILGQVHLLSFAASVIAVYVGSIREASALSFEHPGEQDALLAMKRLPELMKKLNLPFPPGCEPVLILEGSLRSVTSEDAVAICKQVEADELDASFLLQVFFREREGRFRRAVSVAGLIETGGRDIEFSGTPRIEDRVLTVTYETSGTGCMTTIVEKWRFRAALGFELVGYSNSEACLEVGTDEASVTETDINVSTRKRVDAVGSTGHATKTVCRIRGSRRPLLLGGALVTSAEDAQVQSHDREAQGPALECAPSHTSRPKTGDATSIRQRAGR